MTHARIVKSQMVDWIRNCVEMDLPSPTDDEIIDKFNLHGPTSARSLLADLSEEGAITVSWNAPGRPIALGPKEKARFEPARPTRTVTHRSIAEEVAEEATASSARRMHAKRVTSLTPLEIAKPALSDSPPAHPPRAEAAKGRSLVDTPPHPRRGCAPTYCGREPIAGAVARTHSRNEATADRSCPYGWPAQIQHPSENRRRQRHACDVCPIG